MNMACLFGPSILFKNNFKHYFYLKKIYMSRPKFFWIFERSSLTLQKNFRIVAVKLGLYHQTPGYIQFILLYLEWNFEKKFEKHWDNEAFHSYSFHRLLVNFWYLLWSWEWGWNTVLEIFIYLMCTDRCNSNRMDRWRVYLVKENKEQIIYNKYKLKLHDILNSIGLKSMCIE